MMMDSGGASGLTVATMPSNIITSSPSGGRFDFDDGGTYCGGWQDGKAHGHGVCTGPKNVGEYSGSWNFGFEMSGVYKWTNGAVYEGRWQNGKRHGVGVEYNGKWIYKGEWSQGLKGRYGVKASSNSAVKYEGTWANGLQDGYGSETYSDGGYYQGQMCRGLRHGYGVRKSAPYGDSQLNNPSKNGPLTGSPSSMLLHANSIQSTGSASDLQAAARAASPLGASGQDDDDSPKPEDGFKPNIDRTLVSKNGFVLVSKPLDVPMPSSMLSSSKQSSGDSSRLRRNSLTNRLANTARNPNQTTANLLRGLLKKQKSTSDLDAISGGGAGGSKAGRVHQASGGQHHHVTDHHQDGHTSSLIIPFTLSPEELDITDPTTVETYMGEWKHDKRNGHGVCERSDGLKYEGQWHNDMKCGYGMTTFKDGTKEEGKYKNNILVVDSKVKRFFQLGGSNIRQRIDEAIKMANQALTMALKKAEIADNRAATARDKADQAMTAAIEADRDSQIAYSVARQYSDTSLMQQQQQQQQQQTLFGQQSQQQQFGPTALPYGGDPYGLQQQSQQPNQLLATSLNMGASPLQLRRISQNQQRQQQSFNLPPGSQQDTQHQEQFSIENSNNNISQQQLSSANQNIEAFNGRRGSFRGKSQPPSGPISSYARQNSFRQQQHQQHQHQQQHQQQLQQQQGSGRQRQNQPSQYHNRRLLHNHHQSSDPFSDLFDHYKSSPSSSSGYRSGALSGSRRGYLSKQTSLDYAQLRGTSVPRHLGGSGPNNSNATASQQRQRFRVSSSVDQTDLDSLTGYHQLEHQTPDQSTVIQQQALRHLVTSGEQLQLQQQQQIDLNDQLQLNQQHTLSGPTPTNSSYILPSTASTTYNTSPTNQQQQQQTPSPNMAEPYPQHYRNGANMESMYYGQRDVHSLADDQLYMADYRRLRSRQEPLGRTEYENYDFTITSGPRPVQRCRRRTASFTRTSSLTPPVSGGAPSPAAQPKLQLGQSKQSLLGNQSNASKQAASQMMMMTTQMHIPTFNLKNADSGQLANNYHHQDAHLLQAGADASGSYCNSLSSSVGFLNRKPSLQVRYDPMELGGLMSREEVAALSHAQREQKRFEAEMAEKRAKQPLLHLYMSFKEFLQCNRLIITVIVINICLVRMFANLVAS